MATETSEYKGNEMLKVISYTAPDGKTDGIQAGKKKWLAVLENIPAIEEFCGVYGKIHQSEPIPQPETMDDSPF